MVWRDEKFDFGLTYDIIHSIGGFIQYKILQAKHWFFQTKKL
jgi:hypothetical protein